MENNSQEEKNPKNFVEYFDKPFHWLLVTKDYYKLMYVTPERDNDFPSNTTLCTHMFNIILRVDIYTTPELMPSEVETLIGLSELLIGAV